MLGPIFGLVGNVCMVTSTSSVAVQPLLFTKTEYKPEVDTFIDWVVSLVFQLNIEPLLLAFNVTVPPHCVMLFPRSTVIEVT